MGNCCCCCVNQQPGHRKTDVIFTVIDNDYRRNQDLPFKQKKDETNTRIVLAATIAGGALGACGGPLGVGAGAAIGATIAKTLTSE